MKKIVILSSLIIVSVLGIILFFNKDKEIYNVDKMKNDELLLNKWQMLGPFKGNGKREYLDVDNIKEFGYSEDKINYKEFISIKPQDTSIKRRLIKTDEYKVDFSNILGYKNNPEETISGNVYCACILKSSKAQKLKLNFSSNDGAKIWLNNKIIHSLTYESGLQYYQYYLNLDLKKGDNFLLIKINNISELWAMITIIEKGNVCQVKRSNKNDFHIFFNNNFLLNSIVKDTLKHSKEMIAKNYELIIKNQEGKEVYREFISEKFWYKWKKNINFLENGYYNAFLYYNDNDYFTQLFYKGDVINDTKNIIQKIKHCKIDNETKANIETNIYRFNYLLSSDIKVSFERKIIKLCYNIYHSYKLIISNKDPFKHIASSFIKPYISGIDSSMQYYIVHVPIKYDKNNKRPLYVVLPTLMAKKLRFNSYLQSFRVADVDLYDLYDDLANKYNSIVIEPHCRSISEMNRNQIDETDFFESLANFKRYYNIDTNRIYLFGYCSSGWSALKIASKYPDKFACIALNSPITSMKTPNIQWLSQNAEPLNYLKNIKDLPIFDIHSLIDPHNPYNQSEKLIQKAKTDLNNFIMETLNYEFAESYVYQYMDDFFEFCTKYSVNRSPKSVYFSTCQLKYNKSFWLTLNQINSNTKAFIDATIDKNNILKIKKENVLSYSIDLTTLPYDKNKPLKIKDNGKVIFDAIVKNKNIVINPINPKAFVKTKEIEGAFAHIFTKAFTIVIGTNGTKEENEKIKAIADTIQNYWIARYYFPCKVKTDKQITKEDILARNLLLIGSEQSNTIFKSIAKNLPLKVSSANVQICNKNTTGNSLCYYMIYPNPLNRSKYVGIIGSNNKNNISLGFEDKEKMRFEDVSNYGWYDYKVWDYKTPEREIMAGYFDNNWK